MAEITGHIRPRGDKLEALLALAARRPPHRRS